MSSPASASSDTKGAFLERALLEPAALLGARSAGAATDAVATAERVVGNEKIGDAGDEAGQQPGPVLDKGAMRHRTRLGLVEGAMQALGRAR